jgi:preprotein translocase subunit SecB
MKHSPLQLVSYVVSDISCTANPKFNPEQPLGGAFEQYTVDVKVNPLEPTKEFPGHPWSAEMVVTQKIKEGQNFPYEFRIALVGMYACQDGALQTEKEIQFVRVNGSSMLYGIAREHIRALTAAGPWGAIIIPTLSFYEKQPDLKDSTPAKAQ